jgi:hypothetical protein
MSWAFVIALAFAAICLVLGYRVRAGKSRSFYPSYRTNVWYRNAPFALLPFGVWLLAGAGAIVAHDAHVEVAVGVFTVILFAVGTLSVIWIFKPPEFMKPRWLRQVESGAAPEPVSPALYGAPSPSGARRIHLPPVAYWSLWIATAIVFALFVAFAWSWSVLVGLGGAISLLAAYTPRKRDVS